MFFLFISSALCWFDSNGKKIDLMSAEEFYSSRQNSRKVSETANSVQIGNFTFYDFHTFEFDINKTNRVFSYNVKDIYTLAIWNGKGNGPILTLVFTYTEHEGDEEQLTFFKTNTIFNTETITTWIFPTTTQRVFIEEIGTSVTAVMIVVTVVFVVLSILGICCTWSIMDVICIPFTQVRYVRRHKSRKNKMSRPPEQLNQQTTHQEVPVEKTKTVVNDSLIGDESVPQPVARADPYADDYETKPTQDPAADPYYQQPASTVVPQSPSPYAEPAYVPPAAVPYQQQPAVAPQAVDPYAQTAHETPAADPYANVPIQAPPPEANPDDDW
jgi:hypothetical protein